MNLIKSIIQFLLGSITILAIIAIGIGFILGSIGILVFGFKFLFGLI